MAGEAAEAAGMPIVSPVEGQVRDGADEINTTRDLLAQRSRYGPVLPTTGQEGFVFYQIVT